MRNTNLKRWSYTIFLKLGMRILVLFVFSSYSQITSAEESEHVSDTVYLDELANFTYLYSQLLVFHDKDGSMTLDQVRKNQQWFSPNQTKEENENYDPNEVYWVKLILQGNSEKTENYLLYFCPSFYFSSWMNIESWQIHENDSTSYVQTGDQFAKLDKPIPSNVNILSYSVAKNEKVEFYFRLQGADTTKISIPSDIQFILLDEKLKASYLPDYPFNGAFLWNGENNAFASNPFTHHEFYLDAQGKATIEEIVAQKNSLPWTTPAKTRMEHDQIYWMHARLVGNTHFSGDQMFCISQYSGWDYFLFEYMDSYIVNGQGDIQQQRTGHQVAVKEQPSQHWANLIRVDIGPTDTLDLFTRLEGISNRMVADREVMLYHVNSISAFQTQSRLTPRSAAISAILAFQAVFFFLLFLVEKEKMHGYLALMTLGFFLFFLFFLGNGRFVLFPSYFDITYKFYELSYFLIPAGLLKFVETYFNYSSASIYKKWIVPFLCGIMILGNGFIIFQNFTNAQIWNPYSESAISVMVLFVLVSVVVASFAALLARNQTKRIKGLFFLAFTPFLLACIISLSEYVFSLNLSFDADIPVQFSIVVMMILLALSIGYRTNRLKADKEAALQKNLDDQKRVNEAVSRFVPNEFLKALDKTNITEIALGDTVEKEVTVFFSDIRNYTSLAEKMTPQENFRFVNAYNGRMGPIIQKHQGFVNQYLGDGIMAIFPTSPSDALRAAIEMQQAIQSYNQERKAKGKNIIKVGMGMHDGSLIMGITGDENRMDAATISDSVNSASRIENLTKHYGTSILLSEASLKKLDDVNEFHFRYLGEVQVKGKLKPLKIYECFDGDLQEQFALKKATLADFEKGIEYYFEKGFAKAILAFEKVVLQNPKDLTAQLFLNKAQTLDAEGVTEAWTGVEEMMVK